MKFSALEVQGFNLLNFECRYYKALSSMALIACNPCSL